MRKLSLGTLSLGLLVAALCLGERSAHAQAVAVQYLPLSAAFGADLGSGFSPDRYDLPTGWFLGGGKSSAGLSAGSFNSNLAFGSVGGFSREGIQFGYNFKDSGTPFSVYAGFDTLKYNLGNAGAFSPFDSTSNTVPLYRAHAGVEFKPTPNLSLSLGVGYTQSGRVNSDTTLPSLSNASLFDLVGGRR